MLSVAVTEQTQVAEARREAAGHARSLGFAEKDVERVALVATELATNLVRHATLGELLLSTCEFDGGDGVQLIALDDGPGMRDPGACLRDGYSTAGGAGTGLGAVRRLSDQFDVYSRAGAGTAILARLAPHRGMAAASRAGGVDQGGVDQGGLDRGNLAWDAVVQPKPGEQACGDGWSAHVGDTRTAFLMSDGIGHGPLASAATAEAIRVFQNVGGEAPARAMQAIHAALAGTRGAAAAIAQVDRRAREIRYCGIGNICTTIFQQSGSRKAVSQNGTLGHSVRKLQEFVYPFPDGAMLVMHSDGLSTSWDLDGHNGLAGHPPATIAAILYRRHRRLRDDAAVLVVKAT